MAPGSISYHICFQSTFICIYTFCIYIIKYQKYIYLILLSLLDLTFASGREGIDNPFIALVASSLFVCVGAWTFEEPPTGLIPWFSKTEGNTYATIAASPFPLQGKTTQAQDIAAGRTTHLHRQGNQDPREGPSLTRQTTQDLLRSGLARQAREEWRYQGGANLARHS